MHSNISVVHHLKSTLHRQWFYHTDNKTNSKVNSSTLCTKVKTIRTKTNSILHQRARSTWTREFCHIEKYNMLDSGHRLASFWPKTVICKTGKKSSSSAGQMGLLLCGICICYATEAITSPIVRLRTELDGL